MGVTSITYILALLLKIYLDLLIVRIVIEMIQSFSRQFRPPRWFALIAEPIFMVTDPPVKAVGSWYPQSKWGSGHGCIDSAAVFDHSGVAVHRLNDIVQHKGRAQLRLNVNLRVDFYSSGKEKAGKPSVCYPLFERINYTVKKFAVGNAHSVPPKPWGLQKYREGNRQCR